MVINKHLDPMYRFNDSKIKEMIPKSIIKEIYRKNTHVKQGITRIEESSKMKFPEYYVEPFLPISSTSLEKGNIGALFARTIPVHNKINQNVQIIIQLSAPLVAFGLKGTIQAILAHEFLHYVEFIRKFKKMDILSDEISGTLFESQFADAERIFKPRLIFKYGNKSPQIIRHLKEKFQNHSVDEKLNNKTNKLWIKKRLPLLSISPTDNRTRIPVEALINSKFDEIIIERIKELEDIAKK
ncbi:MAG: hypothetical protein CMO13_00710 [Thaumarchaeota archaeon]|nr:hypothetical protein [Nitrososphaerota archaeon]